MTTMKIAIRGEGPADMGVSYYADPLKKGPMIILIENLDCYQQLYLMLRNTFDDIEWVYIHKKDITGSSENRKKMILRGKKQQRKESDYEKGLLKGFYSNSESFACLAKERGADIAIFFVDRDNDSNETRYKQVKLGLKQGEYDATGIPMMPVKTSEAWLMCCLSKYQNCAKHERATTDKTSPDYPKNVCKASGYTQQQIAEECDPNQIDMPSFNRFKEDLRRAINAYLGYEVCN
jgi:hypothetical protein